VNRAALIGLAVGGLVVLRGRAAATDTTEMQTPDPVDFAPGIKRMAEAIAYAEGYYGPGDPVPRRLNNPGDLKASSVPAIGTDTAGHLHFATIELGWLALYRQLQLIVDGRSRVYKLDDTIATMGQRYAPPNPVIWAGNVAGRLRVPTSVRLRDVLVV